MNKRQEHYIPLPLRITAGYRMSKIKETGETVKQISEDLRISRIHLYSLEEKYINDLDMGDKKRSGRPLKVSNYTTRRVLRAMRNEPFKSSGTLTAQVNTNVRKRIRFPTLLLNVLP